MIRTVLSSAFAVVLAATASPGQPPAGAPRPKLASELPTPKVGEKIKLSRSDVKSEKVKMKDDAEWFEVTDVVAKEELTVAIPAASWELDVDGWFDSEGFNITRPYPRSGLWAMRTSKVPQPLSTGSGLPSSPKARVPQAPASQTPAPLYRAGLYDIITHIDGIAVTSYERFYYAVNSAATPRDLQIVVMKGDTGRRYVFYITAYKSTGP